MENNVRRLKIDHALIHICFQALAGIIYGFSVYLIIARGFSSAIAGLCMGLSNAFSLILQPIVSNFLDKSKKMTVFDMALITSICMLAVYLINVFSSNGSLVLVITFIISAGLYASLEPIFNSLSSIFMVNGLNIEFGRARALGSFSYGVVCALFGVLTNNYTYVVVLIGGSVFAFVLTLTALITRKHFNDACPNPIKIEEKNVVSFKDFIKNNGIYMLLCLFLTGIFFGYTGADNFTILIVENVGGNSQDMGIILGVKATLEAVVIFFYSKIRKVFKLNTLLIVSMLFFIVKSYALYSAKSVTVIYLTQIIQMTSFALIIPTMVEYVDTNMERNIAIRGQAFFTMTIGLGSIFSSSLGGFISDSYGIKTTMLVCLIVTIISAFGFIITLLYQQKHHE